MRSIGPTWSSGISMPTTWPTVPRKARTSTMPIVELLHFLARFQIPRDRNGLPRRAPIARANSPMSSSVRKSSPTTTHGIYDEPEGNRQSRRRTTVDKFRYRMISQNNGFEPEGAYVFWTGTKAVGLYARKVACVELGGCSNGRMPGI